MNVRPAIDVSDLPNEVFGQENITWWAAIIGEAIEGFVLVLAVFSYLYLAHDSPAWPPLHTPLPSLGIPTLNLGMMVLSVPAAWYAARAANREDRRGTLIGLVLIVDARHGLRSLDRELLAGFVPSGRPLLVLATKADKLNMSARRAATAAVVEQLRDAFGERADAMRVVTFSAASGEGVPEADAVLSEWLA